MATPQTDQVSAPISDLAGLPARVAALRLKILEATEPGDIERLRTPVEWNEVPPLFERGLKKGPGFDPLDVIAHGTWNGARLLGLDDHLGKIRVGFTADLLVVNGNPLENLRVLYATGADSNVNGRNVHGGGVEWTIKDGIPYHAPTLMKEIKEMVTAARSQRTPQTTASPDFIEP